MNKLIQWILMVLVLVDVGLHILEMKVASINKKIQDDAWQSCYDYRLPYMQIVGGEVYCGTVYEGQSYFIPLNSLPK